MPASLPYRRSVTADLPQARRCASVAHGVTCTPELLSQETEQRGFSQAMRHAVAGGGGIGGVTPAANRFCQLARWRIRKMSQPTNANRPAGSVTSMNQPITPSE